MLAHLLQGVPTDLLAPPVNVLKLSFDPRGLAPMTVNLGEWCAHLLERLHRQCEASGDPDLLRLYGELKAMPVPARPAPVSPDAVFVPLKLRVDGAVLSFLSTTMMFGTPVDVTLSEIAIETFFPADEATAEWLANAAATL